MKKHGILNAQLAGLIAALGHMDTFMICDAGMPIPKGIPIVDIVLCGGVPSFAQVFNAILEETQVEGYIAAEEIVDVNPATWDLIRSKLSGLDQQLCSHNELKERSKDIRFAVRTGEFSPYANVILRAGVVFHA